MTNSNLVRILLSVDEVALVFSLLNQPDIGKSVLINTYGKISAESTQDKLSAASHSLLARGYVSISDSNTVRLDHKIEPMFYPFVKFNNILQVTININPVSGLEIVNIYLGKQESFTAMRIQMGVVYELMHGKLEDLPHLVVEWLDLPKTAPLGEELNRNSFSISMPEFAELGEKSNQKGLDILSRIGLSKPLASALVEDVHTSLKRGTVVLTDMNSENYQHKDLSKAGAGFLYLVGNRSSWLFRFLAANDQTTAKILPGTSASATTEISSLLKLV